MTAAIHHNDFMTALAVKLQGRQTGFQSHGFIKSGDDDADLFRR
jgi:hypothetical protein